MPGAPWFSMGKPLNERTIFEIVTGFILFPIPMGGFVLAMSIKVAIDHGTELTLGEWFWQVIFCSLLGLLVATSLPIIGWQELRRRKTQQNTNHPPPVE